MKQLIKATKEVLAAGVFCVALNFNGSELLAGGSGLNTVVIVNQTSSNSCALGNYLCEQRVIPAENILRISWAGNNRVWSNSEFHTYLLNPLMEMLAARTLTNQIYYLVLSMDIPFQTILDSTNLNSTTSALFYGLKTEQGNDPEVTNSYATSEMDFPRVKPTSAAGVSFLTTMITGNTLAEAKQLVDRSVTSDGNHPSQPVLLSKSTDSARNIRHVLFDNAVFNAAISGAPLIQRTNSNSPAGLTDLLGYQNGLANFSVSPQSFVPGALADSLTSFGGIIFGPNDQTSLLAFLNAGATGSYGTVAEPYADVQKFPDPQVYFYQARGFTLAESYYQSIKTPYLGLIVGEPLAAPFAQAGLGSWSASLSNAILNELSLLAVSFTARDSSRPLQQIDLFVDGKFLTTLTNLPPQAGNQLNVALNGYPIAYTVPANATISNIVSGLTSLINNPTTTNATKIKAFAHGDRIELQSVATNPTTIPFYTTIPSSLVSTDVVYRVSYLPESFPPRLIPAARDITGRFRMLMEIPTALNYVIQATTNLTHWQPVFTNTIPGLRDFLDVESTGFLQRFYRIAGPVPNQPPKISAPGMTPGGDFRLRLESQLGQPCAILVSSNLLDWFPMITNQTGGAIEWADAESPTASRRFYRAWLPPSTPPTISMTNAPAQSNLIRINNALQPYVIEVRTNGGAWFGLITNFAINNIQASAGSISGSTEPLSTFARFSRPHFVTSEAFGVQEYTFFAGTLSNGAWAEFTFTKTNGQTVAIGITNQIAGISSTNLAAQMYSSIKIHPALQGTDGIFAEDFSVMGGQSKFTLRSRSPGYAAARVGVQTRRSAFNTGVSISPGSYRFLIQNLSDLQPRNHLYITAGANQLAANFSLDTKQLSDGYHELTAVAYEGSHVRTQTRVTIPVCISNSPLSVTLTLLDLTNNAPVNATYHIQISANTNNVSLTTLYSTGGAIGFATNNPTSTFDVIGTNLWVGLHPFYAIVETATGQKYRTKTSWVRLQ